jgi:hypothetical protein
MKIYPVGVQAAIASGRYAAFEIIRVFLPSGTYGFWSGMGAMTLSGQAYAGTSLIEIDPPEQTIELETNTLSGRLREDPLGGLTPDVLATIEQEDYHGKRLLWQRIYGIQNEIGADGDGVLATDTIFDGLISQVRHAQDDGGAFLEIEAVTRSYLEVLSGQRVRSDTDQKSIAPTDTFYAHLLRPFYERTPWGRTSP